MLKIGCCGFPIGREEYFKYFSIVEIQKTFYQIPQEKIAIKWRKEAPLDFEFSLKAYQLITHPASSPTYKKLKIKIKNEKNYGFFRPTDEVYMAWEETKKIAQILKAKIILFQSPASFKPEKENVDNLKKFFKKIKCKDHIFVWEPRGQWNKSLIKNLCDELDLVHCVDPFKDSPVYGKIRYFRLHGVKGYNYRYSDEELKYLKKIIEPKINTYI
ncbi:MAG: DUF72 domain-containing protein, partial [Candidatus Omnitrophica bacterium]|nr:DUF72 domain-containing protein [Candidatus Omnitrophota bacterium]